MPKSLAEINSILTAAGTDPADLTAIIADIKTAVRSSDAGVIADLESQLTQSRADAEASLKAANEKSALASQASENRIAQLVDDLAFRQKGFDDALKTAQEKAASDLAAAKKEAEDALDECRNAHASAALVLAGQIATLKQQLAAASSERDDVIAKSMQLAALAQQQQDAEDALNKQYDAIRTARAALISEANRSRDEQLAAEKAARIAAAEAELAKAKA